MEFRELITESYYHEKHGMLLKGDCLDWMSKFPDKSIDMILCDLPYGTTACKWDTIIPFEPLWEQYERIIKDNGAIVLTASQPFTSLLVTSNLKLFKYEIIWEKDSPTNPLVAKKQIMRRHENICIFYKNQPTFNPQMDKRDEKNKRNNDVKNSYKTDTKGDTVLQRKNVGNNDEVYPNSVKKFTRGSRGLHPTQKPISLFEYLIKTYTNNDNIILDNCAGSCTTAIASKNTNRRWICIEQEDRYCDVSKNRIMEYNFSKK